MRPLMIGLLLALAAPAAAQQPTPPPPNPLAPFVGSGGYRLPAPVSTAVGGIRFYVLEDDSVVWQGGAQHTADNEAGKRMLSCYFLRLIAPELVCPEIAVETRQRWRMSIDWVDIPAPGPLVPPLEEMSSIELFPRKVDGAGTVIRDARGAVTLPGHALGGTTEFAALGSYGSGVYACELLGDQAGRRKVQLEVVDGWQRVKGWAPGSVMDPDYPEVCEIGLEAVDPTALEVTKQVGPPLWERIIQMIAPLRQG